MHADDVCFFKRFPIVERSDTFVKKKKKIRPSSENKSDVKVPTMARITLDL